MSTPTDKNHRPIRHGDLLRTRHFRGGPHRRVYYLYHVVRLRADGYLEAVPYEDSVRPHDGGTWNVIGHRPDSEIVACTGLELFDERAKLHAS